MGNSRPAKSIIIMRCLLILAPSQGQKKNLSNLAVANNAIYLRFFCPLNRCVSWQKSYGFSQWWSPATWLQKNTGCQVCFCKSIASFICPFETLCVSLLSHFLAQFFSWSESRLIPFSEIRATSQVMAFHRLFTPGFDLKRAIYSSAFL